jgi:hypothetical protein
MGMLRAHLYCSLCGLVAKKPVLSLIMCLSGIQHFVLRCVALQRRSDLFVFPEMKLRGLVPNFHIHVSVRDLYIPKTSLKQNRQTNPGNI